MGGASSLITIDVDDRAVRAKLQELAHRAAHMRPAMQEIGEVLTASTKQRFVDSTGPDGEPWAPNTALTLERYLGRTKGSYKKSGDLSAKGQRREAGKRPLIDGRYLMNSIHPQPTANQVQVGTGLVYGAAQQFGNPANRFYNRPGGAAAPIPPRPYLGISADDRQRIIEIINDYLV